MLSSCDHSRIIRTSDLGSLSVWRLQNRVPIKIIDHHVPQGAGAWDFRMFVSPSQQPNLSRQAPAPRDSELCLPLKVPLVINSSSSSSSSRVRQYLGLHARPSTSLGCSPTPSHHSRSSCQTRLRMPTRRKLILFMADGSFHVSSSLFLLHKRSCCSVVQLEVRASTDISTHFKVSISQWQLA